MLDKSLRVLIVEPNETQAICVDKMLNRMDYYCVATTRTLIDGLILNSYGQKKFDVLIVPEHMINPNAESAPSGFLFNIDNLFIYACDPQSAIAAPRNRGALRTQVGLPEYSALEDFMDRVVRARSQGLAKSA